MRMRVIGVLFTFVFGMLAGSPAAAAEGPPHVDDGCGDAGRMLELAGHSLVDNPDQERTAGFDIKSTHFVDLPDGVQVVLQLCGEVPDVELQGSGWGVGWALTEHCGAGVGVADVRRSDDPTVVQRVASFSSGCVRPSDLPPGGWWASYSRYHHDLGPDGVEIDGDRIVWTLPRSAFGGEAVGDLTAGTVWRSPWAETRDGRRGTSAWAGDGDDSYDYYLAGPGAADHTWRSKARDFTVGAG